MLYGLYQLLCDMHVNPQRYIAHRTFEVVGPDSIITLSGKAYTTLHIENKTFYVGNHVKPYIAQDVILEETVKVLKSISIHAAWERLKQNKLVLFKPANSPTTPQPFNPDVPHSVHEIMRYEWYMETEPNDS